MASDSFFLVRGFAHISLLRIDSLCRSPGFAHRRLLASVDRARLSGVRLAFSIEARRFADFVGSFHARATAQEREQLRRLFALLNSFPQFSQIPPTCESFMKGQGAAHFG